MSVLRLKENSNYSTPVVISKLKSSFIEKYSKEPNFLIMSAETLWELKSYSSKQYFQSESYSKGKRFRITSNRIKVIIDNTYPLHTIEAVWSKKGVE